MRLDSFDGDAARTILHDLAQERPRLEERSELVAVVRTGEPGLAPTVPDVKEQG